MGNKRPSLVKQITHAFEEITRIGESRHQAKQSGTAIRTIFSYDSLRTHRQRCITALKRLPPEQRPKMLRDLNPTHTEQIIELMKAENLSRAYITNTLGSMRKLSYALNTLGWNMIAPEVLAPNSLYTGPRRAAPRGGYSPEQADKLIEHLSRNRNDGIQFRQMLLIMRATGLRHNEVARLRESDLNRELGTIFVRGTNAKGGRQRLVALPSDDSSGIEAIQTALSNIPTGKNWLWMDGPKLARRLQDAIREACEDLGIEPKGLHGFRGTFTEEFIERRMANAGLSEKEGRQEVMSLLGHNRRAVTYSYMP
jgi:integrase